MESLLARPHKVSKNTHRLNDAYCTGIRKEKRRKANNKHNLTIKLSSSLSTVTIFVELSVAPIAVRMFTKITEGYLTRRIYI